MEDWEYDLFGCTYCGSALCDGDCEQRYIAEEDDISRHVANCTKDGFCYICQCM